MIEIDEKEKDEAGENKKYHWVKVEDENVDFVLFGRKKLRPDQNKDEVTIINKGESIIGLVGDIKPSTKYGKIYVLINEHYGKNQLVKGTSVLNKKLVGANIGDMIKIKYLGKKPSKAGDYHDFEVWFNRKVNENERPD